MSRVHTGKQPVRLAEFPRPRPLRTPEAAESAAVRVGVVDLGGNTARLLVATPGPGGLERLCEERVVLGLGTDIERHGRISKPKLAAAGETVERLHARAWGAGCSEVEVIVTSPGRQSANRAALERYLARGTRKRVRFVTADEEARLAYAGAVACTPSDGVASLSRIAVCDIGGGSSEIAVGRATAPSWTTSLDIGSLRITERFFHHDPPTKRQVEKARAAIRDALAACVPAPPVPTHALATGGTARALRKLVGGTLGADELEAAFALATSTAPRKLARRYGLPRWRARVVPGGVLVLAEIQAFFGIPFEVAGGGLREGAALGLLERPAIAA